MIKTTKMLLEEYAEYGNPYGKIGRLVKSGQLTPIIRGLYETEAAVPGQYLAGSICGPSYLSFEFALAYYGLIPEAVYVYTSATYGKNKVKTYRTRYGTFVFRDVPKAAYPYGVELIRENGYAFSIASAEKALCDKVYALPPLRTQAVMRELLFDDLRLDADGFAALDVEDIAFLSTKYHSINVELLAKFMRRRDEKDF